MSCSRFEIRKQEFPHPAAKARDEGSSSSSSLLAGWTGHCWERQEDLYSSYTISACMVISYLKYMLRNVFLTNSHKTVLCKGNEAVGDFIANVKQVLWSSYLDALLVSLRGIRII